MKLKHCIAISSLAVITAASSFTASAQAKSGLDSVLSIYRASNTKVNDLVHTRLSVSFDYQKRYLYGKAWITLKPHIYASDSLTLDAKGMEIKSVAMISGSSLIPLRYQYNGMKLYINLGRTIKGQEEYKVFIDYIAKPDELKTSGSAAITDAKGLYFINPDGAVADKPVQIWTQGETEASSVWFPTIDSPNQKTTSEISMTVPSKYVTLSNGKLALQKSNADGTRTDTWKMELPHAPYLFMMAVGDFKIYKDKWRDREVNYYLEPKFAPFAKQIFGTTPEMMEFYSKRLGVDFPWNKYSQIVVRDYVSGAMENTSATLHGDFVQKTDRELLDKNEEGVISHELFHQWFGDYVTAESWSNLTVNESFADFGELLWLEHKWGQDYAGEHNREAMDAYLNDGAKSFGKDLVRFHYHDKEDMFDRVTYKKGGRILNMLRNYLGEEVFFKGVQLYLSTNAFKTGEAHQLRLAMEEVSGQDLNWFFNQWYFGSGNPKLDISYAYDPQTRQQKVIVKQTQEGKAFTVPLAIDLYYQGKKERRRIWLKNKVDTFNFAVPVKPDLVNFDGDKILLCQKIDRKSITEYAFQYKHAPLYLDRYEALQVASNMQTRSDEARNLLIAGLNDKFEGLRRSSLGMLETGSPKVLTAVLPVLKKIASSDSAYLVKADALLILAGTKDPANVSFFTEGLKSRSFGVQSSSLLGLAMLDKDKALSVAKSLEAEAKGKLSQSIAVVYAQSGGVGEFPYVDRLYNSSGVQMKIDILPGYVLMLSKLDDASLVRSKLDGIKQMGLKMKRQGGAKFVAGLFENYKHAKEIQLDSVTSAAQKQRINQEIAKINEDIQELNMN